MNYQPILFILSILSILSIHVSISLSSCPFVVLRAPSWIFFVLRGPSWIESRRCLPLLMNAG